MSSDTTKLRKVAATKRRGLSAHVIRRKDEEINHIQSTSMSEYVVVKSFSY